MVRPKEQCQDYTEIQSWPFHYRQILLEKEATIRLVIDFNKLKLQTCPRMVTSLFLCQVNEPDQTSIGGSRLYLWKRTILLLKRRLLPPKKEKQKEWQPVIIPCHLGLEKTTVWCWYRIVLQKHYEERRTTSSTHKRRQQAPYPTFPTFWLLLLHEEWGRAWMQRKPLLFKRI